MSILPACAYSATPCPFAAPVPDSGLLYAQDPAALHYRIDPNRPDPEQVPLIKLTASEFQCGSSFDSLSVEVKGQRLSLGFQHHPHPEALCPGGAGFGPVFDLSGLAPGTYQVFAAPKVACDRGLCQTAPGPATFAGAYTAEKLSSRPLWVSPHKVRAGTSNILSLFGRGFACNDSLSDKQVEVKDGSIRLRLHLMIRTPLSARTACMVDTLFVGHESFSLPAPTGGGLPRLPCARELRLHKLPLRIRSRHPRRGHGGLVRGLGPVPSGRGRRAPMAIATRNRRGASCLGADGGWISPDGR